MRVGPAAGSAEHLARPRGGPVATPGGPRQNGATRPVVVPIGGFRAFFSVQPGRIFPPVHTFHGNNVLSIIGAHYPRAAALPEDCH